MSNIIIYTTNENVPKSRPFIIHANALRKKNHIISLHFIVLELLSYTLFIIGLKNYPVTNNIPYHTHSNP